MKIKKKYSFKDGNQIWRILVSPSDQLVIETRNTDKKEAYYNSLDAFTGKKIFKGYQLKEKYWVGIETIYKNMIFFHKFTKPDMPGHKSIIAFDINTQKVLWENEDFSFLFVVDDKVYCYVQQFEGQNYYALDLFSGKLIEELNLGEEEIVRLNDIYEDEKDYSRYLFPEKYYNDIGDEKIKKIINDKIEKVEVVGDVECAVYEKALLMNYYSKVIGDSLMNKFYALDLESGEEIYSEILNSNVNAYVPDSFFVYKNLLFILKEKSKLIVCEIV